MVECNYCQKETKSIVIDHLTKHEIKTYFCINCNVEYHYWKNDNPGGQFIYAIINNICYSWSFGVDKKKAYLRVYSKDYVIGKSHTIGKVLISFEKPFPEITPGNIEHKIKIMLMFL